MNHSQPSHYPMICSDNTLIMIVLIQMNQSIWCGSVRKWQNILLTLNLGIWCAPLSPLSQYPLSIDSICLSNQLRRNKKIMRWIKRINWIKTKWIQWYQGIGSRVEGKITLHWAKLKMDHDAKRLGMQKLKQEAGYWICWMIFLHLKWRKIETQEVSHQVHKEIS